MRKTLDFGSLKLKIRHFLLQNSEVYRRSMKSSSNEVSFSQVAKELHKKCGIGERRLRRYLSEDINSKSLSITIDDLNCFRSLSNQTLLEFLAYLTGDNLEHSLSWWQTSILDFFDELDLNTRRRLNCTVFDKKNYSKSAVLLDTMSSAINLDDKDIESISNFIDYLSFCKEKRNS